MLTRVNGLLESVGDTSAVVVPQGLGIAFEVLLPAYLVRELAPKVGEPIALHTIATLDSPNQGASFSPRLIGFASPTDRKFFELLTTVKGLGARKGLRAMAQPPGQIAAAIASRDAKSLQKLPEIGKRMAETIIASLDGKVAAFASFDGAPRDPDAPGAHANGAGAFAGDALPTPAARDAADALTALGEPAESARARVLAALERAGPDAETSVLLDDVFARR